MSRILVVAPHPDDETLGCGGTLLNHLEKGDETHWLIMSKISKELGFSEQRIEARKEEIEMVSRAYGFKKTHQLEFLTTRLDAYPLGDLVMAVSEVIRNVQPDLLYLPFRDDVHSDHRVTFDAVSSCSKPFRYPFLKKIRAYETLSETEFSIEPNNTGFKPNCWVNISPFLEKKIEIMALYQGEMGKLPFPRCEENINALATFRGARVGVKAAEAFMNLVEIE